MSLLVLTFVGVLQGMNPDKDDRLFMIPAHTQAQINLHPGENKKIHFYIPDELNVIVFLNNQEGFVFLEDDKRLKIDKYEECLKVVTKNRYEIMVTEEGFTIVDLKE